MIQRGIGVCVCAQRVDRPDFNYNLFPDNYHEPYYMSYVDTDLPALFAAHGFALESNDRVHVSKVIRKQLPLCVWER